MTKEFNAEKIKNDCVQWIRDWFEVNGKDCVAVVGISGGKDSTIVTALCKEALGKDRVFGVLMPNGVQHDIDMAYEVVEYLDIPYCTVNIGDTIKTLKLSLPPLSTQAEINLPPRIRMATLYAVSQSMNGRVANTCNLSEDWVGYSTRYGDSVGDFSPLSMLTVAEVKAIGRALGLPAKFVDKVPSDGLCGKTDEDNLGFSYAELDEYIRTGKIKDANKKKLIDSLHERNKFKLELMPKFIPEI